MVADERLEFVQRMELVVDNTYFINEEGSIAYNGAEICDLVD